MPDAPPAFTCPRCGRTSYNLCDAEEGYCGACHDWTGREFETLRAWARRTLRALSHPGPGPGPLTR
jgi:ribosomal protein L37E